MNYSTTQQILEKFRKHSYISTDSRKVMPGSIFFALKGDNFNANRFAHQALENGAVYAVIDDPEMYLNEKTILVEDVLLSLQDLAKLYRSSLRIPIIGITGTNGKTTTKELIGTALSTRFNTVATPGNFNNHIGVPLTVLSITSDTEIAVVEMGANHKGEIAQLCEIAKPTHGLITNIGKAHLEGFGGYEGVITAKRELYQYLISKGGVLFVNSDNELLMQLSENSIRVTYGKTDNNYITGESSLDKQGYLNIEIKKPEKLRFSTQLAGDYNFENVMAALCIALHFRVDLHAAVKAIGDYKPGMNRSQIVVSEKNRLILDAYNANPTSMRIAIENFEKLDTERKVLILGDMFELGDESLAEHKNIIELLKTSKVSEVYTAGPCFYKASDGTPEIRKFSTTEELKAYLQNHPIQDSTILIKGSRGMKLENLIELL